MKKKLYDILPNTTVNVEHLDLFDPEEPDVQIRELILESTDGMFSNLLYKGNPYKLPSTTEVEVEGSHLDPLLLASVNFLINSSTDEKRAEIYQELVEAAKEQSFIPDHIEVWDSVADLSARELLEFIDGIFVLLTDVHADAKESSYEAFTRGYVAAMKKYAPDEQVSKDDLTDEFLYSKS